MKKPGDIDLANGNVESTTHDIVIHYNPVLQNVAVEFNPDQVRTFEFLLGVIEMAKIWAMTTRMASMQMQAQAQMQQLAHAAQQERILRGK